MPLAFLAAVLVTGQIPEEPVVSGAVEILPTEAYCRCHDPAYRGYGYHLRAGRRNSGQTAWMFRYTSRDATHYSRMQNYLLRFDYPWHPHVCRSCRASFPSAPWYSDSPPNRKTNETRAYADYHIEVVPKTHAKRSRIVPVTSIEVSDAVENGRDR